MEYILQFFYGFIASVAFSIIFQTPKRAFIFIGITGGLGWIVYRYLLITYNQTLLSAMMASIIIGIFSAIIAIVIKMPTITIYLPSLIPLVPGGGMYYTMYHLIMEEMDLFADRAVETTLIAISLATGIFVSTTVVNILNQSLVNTKSRKNTKLHQ